MNDLTAVLGDSKQRLVQLLKDCGEQTSRQASKTLDLAVSTIRQHFTQLEEQGFIERHSRPSGRGRPTVYFRLTDAGRQLYPSGEPELLKQLLDFLSHQGYHRALDDFFRQYWDERSQILSKRLDAADAESRLERLQIVVDYLDDQGFMPELIIGDDGAIELRECNCPLAGAVESTRLPCRLEADLLQRLFGHNITRVEHIPDGYPACVYRFPSDDDDALAGDAP